MTRIEEEYRRRVDAMTPSERLQRAVGMASWARRVVAGQVIAEEGPMSDERLKWEVALRIYGSEEPVRTMIERRLADVSV